MTSDARAVIRKHSKSFSLAAVLLGPKLRDDASGLYAYCRRADDAIDLAPPGLTGRHVAQLSRELDDVYAGRALRDPALTEFQRLVFEAQIPRAYPEALLDGFRLDAQGKRYETLEELYHYCWCVAGSVGAMMCHVLGVRHERALVHGAHLGMAMQLTNICRDVAEDYTRGRVYLPESLAPGLVIEGNGRAMSREQAALCVQAVRRLLSEADVLYASGDAGLALLSFRARLAVATARRVYSAIGRQILARGADVLSGRAVVSTAEKWWHVARAGSTAARLSALTPSFRPTPLLNPLRFPEDVLRF